MKKTVSFVSVAFLVSGLGFAQGDKKAKKEATYHCEKESGDKHEDLPDAKTKADCKKAGGKWKKADAEHKHDHK